MKTFLFALLFSVSALAQPVVGPEVVSSPIASLDDYALAPQRDGFVFAWTAAGRLYASQLDPSLHIAAAPLQVPLVDPAALAVLPAIASNGTSVLVAWHERRAGYGELTYIALLSADARTLLKGPVTMNITKDAPFLTSAGGKYVIYTGDLRYVLNENLDTEAGQFISRNLGGALTRDGDVGTVKASANAPFNCPRICFARPCAGPFPDCVVTSTVTFMLGGATSSAQYKFNVAANTTIPDPFAARPPVIGSNGDSVAGMVQVSNKTDFFFIGTPVRFTLPLNVLGETAFAGNGTDALLVWTSPSLTGAIIHPDYTTSAPFPIAPLGAQPKVVNINSTSFAVVYRIDGYQSGTIAGRIVQLQAARRRGIR